MKNNCFKQTTKSKRQFIMQGYAVKQAKALTRTTRELYQTLLWFQREKDNCFPGYEKIMNRSDIRSKVTISLHLKILIKVGLVKKKRRGKMQSNIYYVVKADELTDTILKNLQRPYRTIIREIKEQMEKDRNIRQAKRELKSKKLLQTRREKTPSNQSYPQKSEVQQMYSNISSNEDINIYSSNLNNENSKFENEKKESRGGGFKLISEVFHTYRKLASRSSQEADIEPIRQIQNKIPIETIQPRKTGLQPSKNSRIREIMLKISADIGDLKHRFENIAQAVNIFKKVESRGVDEGKFVDTLWQIRGLTIEIIGFLDRPGAYFFTVLKRKWEIG